VLVGVALVTFFQAGPLVWLLVVVGGILAAALQHQFLVRRVPAFTFPFILVAWAFIFALRQAGLPAPVIMSAPAGMWSGWWTATNGYGQVIFQGGILAGFLFFLGVFVADSRAALFGLGASVLGAIAAVLLGQPMEMAHAGLFGFNAVLTAIALAGKKYRDLPWMLAGVLLTIALHLGLVESGLLDALGGVLTFPFVVGTWLILGARRAVGK
jgi:urea transporter